MSSIFVLSAVVDERFLKAFFFLISVIFHNFFLVLWISTICDSSYAIWLSRQNFTNVILIYLQNKRQLFTAIPTDPNMFHHVSRLIVFSILFSVSDSSTLLVLVICKLPVIIYIPFCFFKEIHVREMVLRLMMIDRQMKTRVSAGGEAEEEETPAD